MGKFLGRSYRERSWSKVYDLTEIYSNYEYYTGKQIRSTLQLLLCRLCKRKAPEFAFVEVYSSKERSRFGSYSVREVAGIAGVGKL